MRCVQPASPASQPQQFIASVIVAASQPVSHNRSLKQEGNRTGGFHFGIAPKRQRRQRRRRIYVLFFKTKLLKKKK